MDRIKESFDSLPMNLYKRKRFMVIFPYLPNLSKMLSPEKMQHSPTIITMHYCR